MKTNEPHTGTANVNRLEAFGTSFQLPSDIAWSPQPDFGERSRSLSDSRELESGFHDCPAYVCERSTLCCGLWYMVDQQWTGLQSKFLHSGLPPAPL